MKYDFNTKLTKEFPSQIIIDVTEKCNYNCLHCPHANFVKGEHYQGAQLSFDLFKKMVDEAKENEKYITQIRITANGEPLLHKDVFKFIKYAKENSSIYVSLTSNGSLLNRQRRETLFDSQLDMIDISLDAFSSDVYQKVRRGGNYEKVTDNVRKMIDFKKNINSKLKIVVSFVEQPMNNHQTREFEAYWYDKGVDYVVIRKLHSAGGSNGYKVPESLRKKRYPCVYPWERILLNAKGELDYCPSSWEGKTILADYRKVTIKEIWQSKKYNLIRQGLKHNDFSSCKNCEDCTDWVNTSWRENEGRVYADLIHDFKNEKND